jgi:hypothetical protein
MAMSVQNGERPMWAWSGQHVVVVSGWELVAPAQQSPEPPTQELVGAPAPRLAPEVAATGRPAWSWGSPVA